MKKLNPKIIRVGDTVKIINPIFVIRCGYPLCLEDMKKDVDKDFGDDIDKLIQYVWSKDRNTERSPTTTSIKYTLIKHTLSYDRSKDKTYQRILNELAYVRLRAKKYGGKQRTLHTQMLENFKGLEFKVRDIKMCLTGEYIPGWRSSGFDDDASEPAYLTESKTHKILYLETYGQNDDGTLTLSNNSKPLKIEATNVEKTPSAMETPIEYEYRMKQLEKTNG